MPSDVWALASFNYSHVSFVLVGCGAVFESTSMLRLGRWQIKKKFTALLSKANTCKTETYFTIFQSVVYNRHHENQRLCTQLLVFNTWKGGQEFEDGLGGVIWRVFNVLYGWFTIHPIVLGRGLDAGWGCKQRGSVLVNTMRTLLIPVEVAEM